MKFRKKPVVIDAIQWTGKNKEEILTFALEKISYNSIDGMRIFTLEGMMKANIDDWIIKGYSSKQGHHFWPVKPDYFAEHYEEVKE